MFHQSIFTSSQINIHHVCHKIDLIHCSLENWLFRIALASECCLSLSRSLYLPLSLLPKQTKMNANFNRLSGFKLIPSARHTDIGSISIIQHSLLLPSTLNTVTFIYRSICRGFRITCARPNVIVTCTYYMYAAILLRIESCFTICSNCCANVPWFTFIC